MKNKTVPVLPESARPDVAADFQHPSQNKWAAAASPAAPGDLQSSWGALQWAC